MAWVGGWVGGVGVRRGARAGRACLKGGSARRARRKPAGRGSQPPGRRAPRAAPGAPVMVRNPRPERCWKRVAPGRGGSSRSAMSSARSMLPTESTRLATSPCWGARWVWVCGCRGCWSLVCVAMKPGRLRGGGEERAGHGMPGRCRGARAAAAEGRDTPGAAAAATQLRRSPTAMQTGGCRSTPTGEAVRPQPLRAAQPSERERCPLPAPPWFPGAASGPLHR
jgi:hypothetical protein